MTHHNQHSWTPVELKPPVESGFVYVGAAVGPWRGPFPLPSAERRRALDQMHETAHRLRRVPSVRRVDVFQARLRPPGTSRGFEGQWGAEVGFDAVLLIEADDVDSARRIRDGEDIRGLVQQLPSPLVFAGENVRRIDTVDHTRPGVFLFNYFTADDVVSNLDAWRFTAGWFQAKTGLDNSTVILPLPKDAPFAIVNHCRWDSWSDVLLPLIFSRSFRDFVLRVFADHRVAPHPILYTLDRSRRPSGSAPFHQRASSPTPGAEA